MDTDDDNGSILNESDSIGGRFHQLEKQEIDAVTGGWKSTGGTGWQVASPVSSPDLSPARPEHLFRPRPIQRTRSAPPAPSGNYARAQEYLDNMRSSYQASLQRSSSLPARLDI